MSCSIIEFRHDQLSPLLTFPLLRSHACIGGARLLDVCMASGLQKPAQQCRCLGYQEDYPKQAFDYSTLGQDSAQARLNPLVFQHPKLDLDGDVQLFISTLEVPCFNSEQLQREGDLCLRLRAKKQSANFCFEISPEGKLVIDPKNAMIKFTAPGYTRYVEFSLYRRQGKTDYARRLGNAIRSSFMGEPDIVGQ